MVGELVINEKKYPDKLASARKICATMAKQLGLTRSDLSEHLQAKLGAMPSEKSQPGNLVSVEFFNFLPSNLMTTLVPPKCGRRCFVFLEHGI